MEVVVVVVLVLVVAVAVVLGMVAVNFLDWL